jgi:hypothetical protein
VAPLRRSRSGSNVPITPWLHCADHQLAPMCRSVTEAIWFKSDQGSLTGLAAVIASPCPNGGSRRPPCGSRHPTAPCPVRAAEPRCAASAPSNRSAPLEHHTNRTLAHFLRVLRCLLHRSIFSRVGTSAKGGAIQFGLNSKAESRNGYYGD